MTRRKLPDQADLEQRVGVDRLRTPAGPMDSRESFPQGMMRLQREIGNARLARLVERGRQEGDQSTPAVRVSSATVIPPVDRIGDTTAPPYLRSAFTSGQAGIARYQEDLQVFRQAHPDEMLDRYRSGLAEVGSRTMQRQTSPLHQIQRMGRADKPKREELPDPSQLPGNDELVMEVLTFFYPDLPPPTQLNDELRDLAAVLLWKAIEGSELMDWVPRPTGTRPNFKWLIKQAVKAAWRRGQAQGIYEAVRRAVAWGRRSEYEMAKLGI